MLIFCILKTAMLSIYAKKGCGNMSKYMIGVLVGMITLGFCAYTDINSVTDIAETGIIIDETEVVTESVFIETSEPKTEQIHVYDGAIKDFLLPVENFSWERKFAPTHIMIHFASAVVTHPEDLYNIDYVRETFVDYNVSTHYIIERDGTIRCYIPEDRVAWHAGFGTWGDDERYTNDMNQYAIGIELVAIGSEKDMSAYLTKEDYKKLDDSLKGFASEQYEALKLLVDDLCKRYQIPMDREHIFGHDEYSENKTDPGELFEWDRIIQE